MSVVLPYGDAGLKGSTPKRILQLHLLPTLAKWIQLFIYLYIYLLFTVLGCVNIKTWKSCTSAPLFLFWWYSPVGSCLLFLSLSRVLFMFVLVHEWASNLCHHSSFCPSSHPGLSPARTCARHPFSSSPWGVVWLKCIMHDLWCMCT